MPNSTFTYINTHIYICIYISICIYTWLCVSVLSNKKLWRSIYKWSEQFRCMQTATRVDQKMSQELSIYKAVHQNKAVAKHYSRQQWFSSAQSSSNQYEQQYNTKTVGQCIKANTTCKYKEAQVFQMQQSKHCRRLKSNRFRQSGNTRMKPVRVEVQLKPQVLRQEAH